MRTPPGFQPGAPVLTRLQFQASAWRGTTLTALSAQEKNESGGSLVWAQSSPLPAEPQTLQRDHIAESRQAGKGRSPWCLLICPSSPE